MGVWGPSTGDSVSTAIQTLASLGTHQSPQQARPPEPRALLDTRLYSLRPLWAPSAGIASIWSSRTFAYCLPSPKFASASRSNQALVLGQQRGLPACSWDGPP